MATLNARDKRVHGIVQELMAKTAVDELGDGFFFATLADEQLTQQTVRV